MSSKPSALSKPNKKPTVSFVEQMRQSYVSTGKVVQGKGGKRASQGKDTEVLAQLQSFTKLVQTASVKAKHSGPDKALDQIEEAECDLHFVKGCKSCKDTFGKEDEDSGDEGWMNAELRFAKDVGANVYEAKVDDYSVVDPRLAAVDKTKDIFGRGASSGKGTWRDKSLPKTQSRSSVPDAYKYAYK